MALSPCVLLMLAPIILLAYLVLAHIWAGIAKHYGTIRSRFDWEFFRRHSRRMRGGDNRRGSIGVAGMVVDVNGDSEETQSLLRGGDGKFFSISWRARGKAQWRDQDHWLF